MNDYLIGGAGDDNRRIATTGYVQRELRPLPLPPFGVALYVVGRTVVALALTLIVVAFFLWGAAEMIIAAHSAWREVFHG